MCGRRGWAPSSRAGLLLTEPLRPPKRSHPQLHCSAPGRRLPLRPETYTAQAELLETNAMNIHWLSIAPLGAMFVVATALPINMGVLAFVGAFLVGTVVAGMNAKAILGGFPADLFL